MILPDRFRDFDQAWLQAQALLHHQNAYAMIGPGKAIEYPWPMFYPMTAALVALPLTMLPMITARIVFIGIGAFVFAFAITHRTWHRLPAVLGAQFFVAVTAGQWSPLFVGALVFPALGFLYAAKPHIGAALLACARNRKAFSVALIGGTMLLMLSLVLQPRWPLWWRQSVSAYGATSLVTTALGPILLLAALRWRRQEARILLALSLIPHTITPADALPLALVPDTRLEAMVLALLSWGAWSVQLYLQEIQRYNTTVVYAAHVALIFFPALVLVLRRPNTVSEI